MKLEWNFNKCYNDNFETQNDHCKAWGIITTLFFLNAFSFLVYYGIGWIYFFTGILIFIEFCLVLRYCVEYDDPIKVKSNMNGNIIKINKNNIHLFTHLLYRIWNDVDKRFYSESGKTEKTLKWMETLVLYNENYVSLPNLEPPKESFQSITKDMEPENLKIQFNKPNLWVAMESKYFLRIWCTDVGPYEKTLKKMHFPLLIIIAIQTLKKYGKLQS